MSKNPAYLYDKKMCTDIVHFLSRGDSVYDFCAYWKISTQTLYVYLRNEPDFYQAFLRGVTAGKGGHLKKGENNIENPDFSHKIWDSLFKHKFKDSYVRINSEFKNMSSSEQAAEILRMMADNEMDGYQGRRWLDCIHKKVEIVNSSELQNRIEVLEQRLLQMSQKGG